MTGWDPGGPPAPGHRTLNRILRDAIRARRDWSAVAELRAEYDAAAAALFGMLTADDSHGPLRATARRTMGHPEQPPVVTELVAGKGQIVVPVTGLWRVTVAGDDGVVLVEMYPGLVQAGNSIEIDLTKVTLS